QFSTQTPSFSWQWSAAAYTSWPLDWNAALIQPYHGRGPTGSQHAGTPDNTTVQKSLIQGPRGGGGSNFTGSWSATRTDRKSTRLNSSHGYISYAVFCLKKK